VSLIIVVLIALGFLVTDRANGQSQPEKSNTNRTDELVRKNLSHVAATPGQIEEILQRDAGLLLEVKNLLARRAAEQGRLLTDDDLTDTAVFDLLRADTQFRSAVTKLLQRYGYLVPDLNPDSQMGKQQDYLMQQRTREMVARESAPPSVAVPQPTESVSKTRCNPEQDLDCEVGTSDDSTEGNGGEEHRNLKPDQQGVSPNSPLSPNSPITSTSLDLYNLQGNNESGMRQGSVGGADSNSRLGGSRSDLAGLGGESLDSPFGNMSTEMAMQLLGRSGNTSAGEEVPNGPSSQPVSPSKRRTANSTESAEPPAALATPGGRLVHVKNPYDSVPVLYDMYFQAPDRTAPPKRFGADAFRRGTSSSGQIPMDLPAGPSYVVGPGDTLTVNLWGMVTQRITRQVDREGRLALPEVGPVMISGKTLGEVQETVQNAMRSQYRNVSADVSVSRLRTVRVYVVGEVARPGAYDLNAMSTPLNGLFVSGGPTLNGSMRHVQHFRGSELLEDVDVYDLLLKGVRTTTRPLDNGDTIRVQTIGAQVTVEGAVRRPAIYELRGERDLAEVIELAGGMLPIATLRHIEVQRLVEHQTRSMLSLDVSDSDDQKAINAKLATFNVQPEDVVHIFPIGQGNPDTVYLQGHVLRPGKYTYKKNMRLSDLISSYEDLLPEPATQYAEIIRLQDFTHAPVVFSFNLKKALADPLASPILQPLDTVRIYGRFDFEDTPSVTVTGAVRRPGIYPTTGAIHVTDAIHQAGNLTPEGSFEDVQVFHHEPDGNIRVLSIDLKRAEGGDPLQNLLLAPGDRLIVHEDQMRSDPGTVTVQGDVVHPGKYPVTSGLRLSDLIREAGGLKRSADQNTADLIHVNPANPQNGSQQQVISLASVFSGEENTDPVVRNGDVLTIRELPGWKDLGATMVVAGEVQHPGTYGIIPGERLSSALKRAGGFGSEAFPYGAILTRADIRQIQDQNRLELMRRLEAEKGQLKLLPDTDPDQKRSKDAAIEQLDTMLRNLSMTPAVGRVVIHISSHVERWANTADDIQVRAGDKLFIPKRLETVGVSGQVYTPTAVSYRPGRSAEWYLGQSGGTTGLANKKAIFVIRADGSVLSSTEKSFWSGSPLKATLLPGDTIVVPEKAYTGPRNYQNALIFSQILSALASAAYFSAVGL
jgi:protein involved in polysaccharide export with SLBB domain